LPELRQVLVTSAKLHLQSAQIAACISTEAPTNYTEVFCLHNLKDNIFCYLLNFFGFFQSQILFANIICYN